MIHDGIALILLSNNIRIDGLIIDKRNKIDVNVEINSILQSLILTELINNNDILTMII